MTCWTGASDPAMQFPLVVEELKAAGLDTVIEEAQKQVDEFCELICRGRMPDAEETKGEVTFPVILIG